MTPTAAASAEHNKASCVADVMISLKRCEDGEGGVSNYDSLRYDVTEHVNKKQEPRA